MQDLQLTLGTTKLTLKPTQTNNTQVTNYLKVPQLVPLYKVVIPNTLYLIHKGTKYLLRIPHITRYPKVPLKGTKYLTQVPIVVIPDKYLLGTNIPTNTLIHRYPQIQCIFHQDINNHNNILWGTKGTKVSSNNSHPKISIQTICLLSNCD